MDAKPGPSNVLSVAIGGWAVAAAPTVLRTLLGSCVAVALHDRRGRIGGLNHIVLPDSRGAIGQDGKYADTAIPRLVADLAALAGGRLGPGVTAKLLGGASMFAHEGGLDIGRLNREAAEGVLASLGIPVVARDLGGDAGRRLTFDTATGIVAVKIPGGADYEV